ncbi:LuxR C-terminal-related transcriptional regulator [Pseudonocardia sp. RS010]|uniref:LuxR C-terminal-related transcriptional regulator n=1 Tax=Pseudonocardia sp. RS010 TaxID=3385979 RepID=UPI0039A134BF
MPGDDAPPLVADRLAASRAAELVGRAVEQRTLASWLDPAGPAVGFVHGPGGIGKTSLVRGTLTRLGRPWVELDAREVEPTPAGALSALGRALGRPVGSPAEVSRAMSALGTEVLVVDSYERWNLLDGWLRAELVAAFPARVTTLLVGRRPPNLMWRTSPGWRPLVAELAVGPLRPDDLDELLRRRGLAPGPRAWVGGLAHGHPLAAAIAAEALQRSGGAPAPAPGTTGEVAEELFEVLLDDLDPAELEVVEAATVLRRVTRPLLRSVLPGHDADRAWSALRRIPLTRVSDSGLELAGVARAVALDALERRDPDRVRALRTRAAHAILDGPAADPHSPDWETTADLMHLVRNPVIRNAYAPPGGLQHPAERAWPEDGAAILAIASRFTGAAGAALTETWWRERPQDFHVTRAAAGVVAFSTVAVHDEIVEAPLRADPVLRAVTEHLRRHPPPPGSRALLVRSMLGHRHGELTSPEVATLVVDLKRSYLEHRATLRRVYTAVHEWEAVAPLLRVMGFVRTETERAESTIPPRTEPAESTVPPGTLAVGGLPHHLAVLDFGPAGLDGWIARHVLDEQRPAAKDEPPRPPVLELTPREQEVLSLLASGMTNVELARTLFISERTANRHVSNIYTKLGVRNRAEATRVAVEAGIAS